MAQLEVGKLRIELTTRDGTAPVIDDLSFALEQGETLGLVGESGCGKSMMALAVARLVPAHTGTADLDGDDILATEGEDLRRMRQKIQFIFRDPCSSLNPRKRVLDILREPLDRLTETPRADRTDTFDELFGAVGLRANLSNVSVNPIQNQEIAKGDARLDATPDLRILSACPAASRT